jgi:hypothetical protein
VEGRSLTEAGVAGASGGTILVTAAGIFLSGPELDIVRLAAPALAVAITGVYYWAQMRLQTWIREREMRAIVTGARAAIYTALKDCSPEREAELRAELRFLEDVTVQMHMQKVRDMLGVAATRDG